MATAATLAQYDNYDESRQLAWFDRYVGAQHDDAPELRPYEVSKLDALRDDIVWLQQRDRAGEAARDSWLGKLYAAFERLGSAPRHANAHVHADESAPPPGPFDAEYVLLDRLSIWYGGLYRGAIVFNCFVAMVAAVAGVFAAKTDSEVAKHVIGVLEVICLFAIIGLYAYGHTPRRRPGEDVRRNPWARRWHERWIQYRLLAERFRYASLLQPFAGTTEERWRRLLVSEMAPLAWYDRYFLWRMRVQEPYTVNTGDWRKRLAAVMEHQARYHLASGTRRQHVVHRLESFTRIGFVVAVVSITLYVGAEWAGWKGPDIILSMAAGLATAVTAAIHGILRTTELARIADTSLTVEQRIRDLRGRLDAVPAAAPVETLAPIVEQFCRLVTQEASGWNAMLRDKDIPLAH